MSPLTTEGMAGPLVVFSSEHSKGDWGYKCVKYKIYKATEIMMVINLNT